MSSTNCQALCSSIAVPWKYNAIFVVKKILIATLKKQMTSVVIQWLRFCTPSVGGGLGWVPGQGIRSCLLHLSPGAAKKKKGKKVKLLLVILLNLVDSQIIFF